MKNVYICPFFSFVARGNSVSIDSISDSILSLFCEGESGGWVVGSSGLPWVGGRQDTSCQTVE